MSPSVVSVVPADGSHDSQLVAVSVVLWPLTPLVAPARVVVAGELPVVGGILPAELVGVGPVGAVGGTSVLRPVRWRRPHSAAGASLVLSSVSPLTCHDVSSQVDDHGSAGSGSSRCAGAGAIGMGSANPLGIELLAG